jgi:hypothetical protein
MIYDLVDRGRLWCQRVGRAIRIAPADLESYLRTKRATPGWPNEPISSRHYAPIARRKPSFM